MTRSSATTADDFLNGDRDNDALFRLEDADMIVGAGGRDTLEGGLGNDSLTGGVGRDVFRLFVDSSLDTISDFEEGADKIDLRGLGIDWLKDLDVEQTQGGLRFTSDEGTTTFLVHGDLNPEIVAKSWFIFD